MKPESPSPSGDWADFVIRLVRGEARYKWFMLLRLWFVDWLGGNARNEGTLMVTDDFEFG